MNQKKEMPVSTQWVLDAVGPTGRAAVEAVYMIICKKTSSKGSGFLVDNGVVVTNEHVIRGCAATEISAISSFGEQVTFTSVRSDASKDLAALIPAEKLNGGLSLARNSNVEVEASFEHGVSRWATMAPRRFFQLVIYPASGLVLAREDLLSSI